MNTTTTLRKIRVAGTIVLAFLLVIGGRKRSYENVHWRSAEAVGSAYAVCEVGTIWAS